MFKSENVFDKIRREQDVELKNDKNGGGVCERENKVYIAMVWASYFEGRFNLKLLPFKNSTSEPRNFQHFS